MKEEKSKKGLLSYHYKVSFEEYLVADRSKKHISLIKSILYLKFKKSKYCVVVETWCVMSVQFKDFVGFQRNFDHFVGCQAKVGVGI